jgi:hypothetical protein
MRKIILATMTLATVVASPAFAQKSDNAQAQRAHRMTAHARATAGDISAQYTSEYNNPNNVYVGNSLVGRDPDPSIRLMLKRDNLLDE